jgi:hypothetical protein
MNRVFEYLENKESILLIININNLFIKNKINATTILNR